MKNHWTNLFIVDDDRLMITTLKKHLQDKFGSSIKISTFYDGDSCIEKVNEETDIVILDYFMEGKNGLETLKSIKEINPKTEVIMLTSNDSMAVAMKSFRMGAKDYVIKGEDPWEKVTKLVNHIVTTSIRIIVREFGISEYMGIFLLTFFSIGVIVLLVLLLEMPLLK